jgi:peptide/nickel transport system substrate-binding protein
VRFENYWGEGPNLERVVMVNFSDDNARVNALSSGQVDAIDSVPYPQIPVIEGNGSLKVLAAKPGEWRPLTMRVTSPPFDDNRVRQAFRLLADRDKMIEQALAGRGRVANDLYAPQDAAYASDIPQREYDPEQAKSLLKQAGHDNLTVELITSPVKGGLVEACEVFAQSAKAGGVTVNVKRVDSGTLYGDQYLKWAFAVDYWPTKSYLLTASNTDGPNAELNETNFDDPEFNKLYKQAYAELDEDARKDIIHRMQEIQHERGGYIIWAFPNQYDAYSAKTTGFTAGLSGEPFGNWDLKKVGFVSA